VVCFLKNNNERLHSLPARDHLFLLLNMSLQENMLDLSWKCFCWVLALMRVISPTEEGVGGGEEGKVCAV